MFSILYTIFVYIFNILDYFYQYKVFYESNQIRNFMKFTKKFINKFCISVNTCNMLFYINVY